MLKYFLAIAREESFLAAAEALHVTQPTLSRQIQDLEYELGKPLIIRGSRKIQLTEEGMLFKQRAAEIVELSEKAKNEVANSSTEIRGDIYIGAGETSAMSRISKVAVQIRKNYPDIHFNISSGDGQDIYDDLQNGLLDFGLVFGEFDTMKYNFIPIYNDTKWGLLVHKKSHLATKEKICPNDMDGIPLMVSRQFLRVQKTSIFNSIFTEWLGKTVSELNIVGSYSLLYNAKHFVEQGFCNAVAIDGIINTKGSDLLFIPFELENKTKINLIWKRYQIMNKASRLFLEEMEKSP